MVGTVIGNYKLLQMIGAGGMGTVYEAVQQPIGRRVAIKVLHPEFAHDRDVLKRFFNEARAANLINHPSIVQVSDYGQLPNGSAYLAMEYLDGFTLDDHVIAAGGKISPDQAQHIAWQLASALSAAHTAGIVHRDAYEKTMTCFRVSAKDTHRRRKSHGYSKAEDSSYLPLQLV